MRLHALSSHNQMEMNWNSQSMTLLGLITIPWWAPHDVQYCGCCRGSIWKGGIGGCDQNDGGCHIYYTAITICLGFINLPFPSNDTTPWYPCSHEWNWGVAVPHSTDSLVNRDLKQRMLWLSCVVKWPYLNWCGQHCFCLSMKLTMCGFVSLHQCGSSDEREPAEGFQNRGSKLICKESPGGEHWTVL